MPHSPVKPQFERLLTALFAVWVCLAAQTSWAQARPEGPGYAVVGGEAVGSLCPGETRRVELTLENTGGRTWDPKSKDRLAYHWRDDAGELVVRDGWRTELPEVIAPGEQVSVDAKLTAPKDPGRYQLVWRMLREGDDWYPEGPATPVVVLGTGTPLAWSIEPFELPDIQARGEASAVVTVTNEGCAPWTPETLDRLSYRWFAPDGTTKRGEGPRTSFDSVVRPGESATVDLRILGPQNPGRYVLRVAPVRERVAWFGDPTGGDADARAEVRNAALQWAWVSAAVPGDVAAGDTVTVDVELRNTGTERWDPERGDRLSYHWVRDGTRLRREGRRTVLTSVVEPGESLRIPVTVVAPDEPGPVQLSIEPLRERVAWFGPPVESALPKDGPVLDVAPPAFVWTQLGVRTPKFPLAGRDTEFTLVVRNDGSRAWDPKLGDRASYKVLDTQGNRVARGRRTRLPRRIEPGEVVALSVSFDTPREPGDYRIAFGLVREHVRWFESDAKPVPLRIIRRSSLWFFTAGLMLLGWLAAARHGSRWADAIGWPVWTVVCVALLTELFADLARLQVFPSGTLTTLSIAAGVGAVVAFVPWRRQPIVAVFFIAVLSLVAWVDLAYAAFFGSLAPLTAVAAIHHLADAKATVGSTIRADHVWLVVPPLSALAIGWTRKAPEGASVKSRRWTAVTLALLGVYAVINLTNSVRGSLGVRIFSEAHNAQRFGYVGAHAFQAMRLLRDLGAPPLTDQERADTFAQLQALQAAAPAEGRGIAAGSNLVVLQVEALQQWVVDAEIDGVPVMPFLSQAHENALAYDRIYDQTLQGRTSDAEYLVLGSGHALPEGALSFLRADNEFRTIVHALTDRGYASYSAHPYQRGFWNRSVLHPAYGFARSDFQAELGRGPKSGWGLADGPFLERFDQRLAKLPEPFIAFGITLSLHHPYKHFPKALAEIDVGELQGTWVGNYVQAMNHFDRSLAAWLSDMEARGQLEHTVVVVYGDHVTGMDLNDDVAKLAGVPDERFTQMRMHRVPAFIWVPAEGMRGRRSMVGGQIDLGVTALHLLGVDPPASAVGTPLVGDGPGFAALPTGGAVDGERMLVRRGGATPTKGACIDPSEPGGAPRAACDALEQRALEQLDLARRVLDHDLYRDAEAAR